MIKKLIHRSYRPPSKVIVKGLDSHLGILRGARILSKAVATTLGPGGRNVAIDPWTPELENDLLNYPKPIITKDGVTVAQNINLSQN